MTKALSKKLEKHFKEVFDEFRKAYPGKRRGLPPEWQNFVNRQDKPGPDGMRYTIANVIFQLPKALDYQSKARDWEKAQGIFVPSWKNLQTWINKNCWDEEHPEYDEFLTVAKESFTTTTTKSEADKLFGA
jgi:hypothetical protein